MKQRINDAAWIIYWLAAVRADLEGIASGSTQPIPLANNALRCLAEADRHAELIFGKKRPS